jgi:hypothetical protein
MDVRQIDAAGLAQTLELAAVVTMVLRPHERG